MSLKLARARRTTDGDNATSWNSNTSNVDWSSAARREIFRSATRTSTILADFAPSIDLSSRKSQREYATNNMSQVKQKSRIYLCDTRLVQSNTELRYQWYKCMRVISRFLLLIWISRIMANSGHVSMIYIYISYFSISIWIIYQYKLYFIISIW